MIGAIAAAIAAAGPGPGAAPLPAVIVFDFDPVTTAFGIAVRWQILAVAAIVLLCILFAALIAIVAQRRRDTETVRPDVAQPETLDEVVRAAFGEEPAAGDAVAAAAAARTDQPAAPSAADAPVAPAGAPAPTGSEGQPPADPTPADPTPADPTPADPTPAAVPPIVGPIEHRLRLDDLLFIVVAGVAGAVVGGRLGYVLLYLDYYRVNTDAILDASQGSLTLAGGVAGGVATALLVATILGAPVRRWLGVAIVPLLLALGLGKLAMVLGGAGQGVPSAGEWSTAFAGPGPWGSLAPQIPSDPSQVYEALTTGGALLVVLALALVGPLRRRPVILFAGGVGLWAIGRFAVAYTWRDPVLVGQLNGDQLVTIGIAVVCGLAIVASIAAAVRERRRRGAAGTDAVAGSPSAMTATGAAMAATAAGAIGVMGDVSDDDLEILPADEPHPVLGTAVVWGAGTPDGPARSLSDPEPGPAVPAGSSDAPGDELPLWPADMHGGSGRVGRPSDVPAGTGSEEPSAER